MIEDDAQPSEHFAKPPYRAELFNKDTGWSGVMNRDGMNVLTFKSKPGAVVTSFQVAQSIAEKWNQKGST